MKFNIGDRVSSYLGLGTIVDIEPNSIGVSFDKPMQGHDCRGQCHYGYGWYLSPSDIVLLDPPTKEAIDQRRLKAICAKVNALEHKFKTRKVAYEF